MTKEECEQVKKSGYDMAARLAAMTDVPSPNDWAAKIIVRDIGQSTISSGNDRGIDPAGIVMMQERTGIDLTSFLLLERDDQVLAAAFLSGGALQFAAEHPDKKD